MASIYTSHLLFQVLSSSVSKALSVLFGNEATGTAKFVEMADKFFDALNVHNYSHGASKLKPFHVPYTSSEPPKSMFYFKYSACISLMVLSTVVGYTISGIFNGLGEVCKGAIRF